MASTIAEEVCMDDSCIQRSMDFFHESVAGQELHETTEEDVRHFVEVVEKLASPPELITTCEATGAHMSFESSEEYAEAHGGRLATSDEL